jgi:isopentenyl-diphosphate delta-isomerase
MIQQNVILVDEHNREVGLMEKMEAHHKGLLHRAFSVFVFNENGELLLQRRAFGKYHSEGLWTNTCCSHPYPGESILEAGKRRLFEEMGFTCELSEVFAFIYKAELENGLIEHELDHVLVGFSEETPHLNLEEVSAFKWMSVDEIKADMKENPLQYTAWFRILIEEHESKIQNLVANESL